MTGPVLAVSAWGAFATPNSFDILEGAHGETLVQTERPVRFTRGNAAKKYAGQVIVVPVDFLSDGASIPAVAWYLVGTRLDHDNVYPGVVHDWLWRNAGLPGFPTLGMANRIFYEALRAEGKANWKAMLMYQTVRVASHFRHAP